jgi:hypothetical protein
LAVFVWRFGESFMVRTVFWACAWFHCELFGSFASSLRINADGELHLFNTLR